MIIEELYDALKDAGASDEKARAAARALASQENRFGKLETDITLLRADVTLLKWMMGYLVGAVTALLFKMFL